MIRIMLILSLVSCATKAEYPVIAQNPTPPCNREWFKATINFDTDDYVNKADYIAIYENTKTRESTIRFGDTDFPLFYYSFDLKGRSLKGRAPKHLTILSGEPYRGVPPFYKNIEEMHDNVGHKPFSEISKVYYYEDEKLGWCGFLPRFVSGHQYLIFGNLNAPMSYEPINDLKNDHWYLLIKAKLGK